MNQVWKSAPNLEKGKGIPYQNLSNFYTIGALDDTRKSLILSQISKTFITKKSLLLFFINPSFKSLIN
jgi:hypothetical protein